jgi:hypothetical protein
MNLTEIMWDSFEEGSARYKATTYIEQYEYKHRNNTDINSCF